MDGPVLEVCTCLFTKKIPGKGFQEEFCLRRLLTALVRRTILIGCRLRAYMSCSHSDECSKHDHCCYH
jgi:hypothetical protein